MSGAFLQHLGTKFCFVNLSNLSYSTKRATDGEVCVLKGWRATAECLWCQFYPFVIRQRGKMLMRAKLGVCFYQRFAYFTAPWLTISQIGYSNCLSPSSPFLGLRGDKNFLPRVCHNQVSRLMCQDYSQPHFKHSPEFRGPPAAPRDPLWWNSTASQMETHTPAPPVPPTQQSLTFKAQLSVPCICQQI